MAVPANIQAMLQTSLAGEECKLFLANLLESLDEGLLCASRARGLLADLAREAAAHPTDRFTDVLYRVCLGIAGKSEGYVRQADTSAVSAGVEPGKWTTLVSATTWTRWHCDSHQPSVEALGAFPPGPDPDFAQRFRALIDDGGWAFQGDPATGRAAATLGQAPPAGLAKGPHCWVSCTAFDDDVPSAPSNVSGPARRVHEALGLEPPASGSPFGSWLRYVVDAHAVFERLGVSPVRPCAADLGNRWFRVRSTQSRAAAYADGGWGCTVHLTVVRARRRGNAGRPERVVAPIPVAQPFVVDVHWLPPAPRAMRGITYPFSRFSQSRPCALDPGLLCDTVAQRLWP